ncbi:hypothetical protein AALA82_13815 [Oscillospiraceae bacterium 50-16]
MADIIPDDSTLVKKARLAVKLELQKKRALGLPITRFNPKTRELYRENPDGSITSMGILTDQRRYSERLNEKA